MAKNNNETIKDRLRNFSPEVAKLALSAIELSESHSEVSVAEQLENVVRRIIREREG